MSDIIVTVKMPLGLLRKLKDKIKDEEYIDTSEGIRSILRENWKYTTNPALQELKSLRSQITKQLKEKNERIVNERVVEELARIKDLIEKRGVLK